MVNIHNAPFCNDSASFTIYIIKTSKIFAYKFYVKCRKRDKWDGIHSHRCIWPFFKLVKYISSTVKIKILQLHILRYLKNKTSQLPEFLSTFITGSHQSWDTTGNQCLPKMSTYVFKDLFSLKLFIMMTVYKCKHSKWWYIYDINPIVNSSQTSGLHPLDTCNPFFKPPIYLWPPYPTSAVPFYDFPTNYIIFSNKYKLYLLFFMKTWKPTNT